MINTDMTTAEAERIYKEMEEMFGDKLPNLLHHPTIKINTYSSALDQPWGREWLRKMGKPD